MAQGSVAVGAAVQAAEATSGSVLITSQLSPDELHEVQQYEKLLRFRDDVVSGKHPRIKPAGVLGKVAQGSKSSIASTSPIAATPESSRSNGTNGVMDGRRPVNVNLPSSKMPAGLPGLGNLPSSTASSRPFGKQPEINPVLLQKSDDLIKAEIQLQRQKLERSLKDEIEQRRTKASDQMAELDVADIWAKALTLTQDTLAPVTDEPEPAANASAASDSFDDNTFYSSQHGTPDSQMAARIPNQSEDDEMRDASPYEPQFDPEPAPAAQTIPGVPAQHKQPETNTLAPAAPYAISGTTVPGLSLGNMAPSAMYGHHNPSVATAFVQSNSASRSEESANAGSAQTSNPHDLSRVSERLLGRSLAQQPPPLVRGHDLSPIAPQPERVSPLAPLASLARQPHLAESDSNVQRATPAQVAALRKETSNASSPDSSPQANKPGEKKKNKKKKRKAERLAALETNSAATPYIKPEPRSPSPLTAGTIAPYARPNKRQRQNQPQPSEVSYGEHRYEQPTRVEEGFPERYEPRGGRQERVVGYERADEYRTRHDDEPVVITSPRYERVYYEDPRAPPLSARSVHPDSPSASTGQYVPREVRTVRPVSRVVDASFEEAPFYRDVRTASRMGARPSAYRERSQSPIIMYGRQRPAMAPPSRVPARRIIIDADGREYLEPIVPASERVFERLPAPRAVSRRPETIDDDVAYQSTSPAYAAPRRVVAQPEFAGPETRYREAGISSVMPPPAGEYTPARPEAPREYITRPTSVRPPMESVRYESAYDRIPIEERPLDIYGGRSVSVRPSADNIRYEVPVAYERRVIGAGGVEEYVPLRSASVRPLESVRYDYAPASSSRVGSIRPEYIRRGDGMQPPRPPPPPQGTRSYSVIPGGAGSGGDQRRDYSMQPAGGERFSYGRTALQGQFGEDEDVVFLERAPQREMR
ncbi:hypothetical protein QBC42DRAFT_275625 [Cladorrhinum samala]|uniref:Uncharacterized protein n=1 Tax=Cladorrhinum samala TaxID=585594 RepID=A0AAV9HDP4_9PEZI|nr:hypothetical protein QBC42DRAFT_275625 [Cladorrhinum samala]